MFVQWYMNGNLVLRICSELHISWSQSLHVVRWIIHQPDQAEMNWINGLVTLSEP